VENIEHVVSFQIFQWGAAAPSTPLLPAAMTAADYFIVKFANNKYK
jgi:hypothetical protein